MNAMDVVTILGQAATRDSGINWTAIVSAIAAFFLALLNLYLIVLKPRYVRPRFAIEFIQATPYCRDAMSSAFHGASTTPLDSYWLRLQTKNSGRSVAKRCLGKLVQVMDKYGLVLDCFDPMQLHWVGTSWKEYPFRNIDLNRGDYEYLDLLVAQANNMHIYITGDQFPWARYEQRAIPTTLSIGKYILKVTLYGDDVEPKTVYISLVWGGNHQKDVKVTLHGDLQGAKHWFK